MKLFAVVREVFGWVVIGLVWLREIAGWVLLVWGLLLFYQCFYVMVSSPPRILQVILPSIIAFIIFRAGLHLLKVSGAALVCLKTQEQLAEGKDGGPRRPARPTQLRQRSGPFELDPRSRAS